MNSPEACYRSARAAVIVFKSIIDSKFPIFNVFRVLMIEAVSGHKTIPGFRLIKRVGAALLM